MSGYDIVGDIHGHASELKRLLNALGYSRLGSGYRRPDRKVVFVGDFVDRGPEIAEVIEIARSTVDSGDGFAVMGNHEYNAIAFHTAVPGSNGCWFREHSSKNLKQHQATLDQLSPNEMASALEWFKTLPTALELNGIRVAHAAWQDEHVNALGRGLETLGRINSDFLTESETAGSDLNAAVDNVLKGPELRLPSGYSIVDKGGHERNTVRIKWYEEPAGRSYREFHFGSDDVPDVAIEPEKLTGMTGYPPDAPPVFVGHYWLTGQPTPLAPNVACTDYSVAKGGKLVAYRWDGESVLQTENYRYVTSKP